MKRIFLLPLLAAYAMMTSCGTSTGPATDDCSLENSVKLQTGNWWVYDSYNTNVEGVMIPNTNRLDSVVVEGTEVKLGKTAYTLVNYSTSDGGITYTQDTTWMAVEGGQVYTIDENLFPLPCKCMGHFWVKIADCGADTWKVLDTITEDGLPSRLVLPGGGDTVISSLVQSNYVISGRKGGESTITIAGQPIPIHEYRSDYNLYAQIIEPEEVEFIGGGRKARQVKPIRFFLAKNIGIVMLNAAAEEVIHTLNDGTEKNNMYANTKPGIRRNLLRWSVK